MGRLERKLSMTALAIALAKKPGPHRHSSAGPPVPVGAPLPPRPAGKWPTPQYKAHRKLAAERAEAEARRQRGWR